MESFLGILAWSAVSLSFTWYCVPCFYVLLSWLCENFGINPELNGEIATALGTIVTVGIGAVSHENETLYPLKRELESLKFKMNREHEQMEAKKKEYDDLYDEYLDVCAMRDRSKVVLEKLSEETAQSAPWFAAKVADATALVDGTIIRHLRTKKNPALRAAEQVQAIAKEKRELLRHSKELEYQLQFYEELFPWLEEFKTIPAPEAVEYVQSSDGDYDCVRMWLSPEEYAELSDCEKNQLALDRYKKRKKSDWDVGIEYERYIGYLAECAGYRVTYNGATQWVSDMGRDIIATDGQKTLVIQCKRWAKEKEIHEKHIFQLYGTTVLMHLEKGTPCTGMLVTTARLSPLARKCADFLEIECFEDTRYIDYPLIKCNVSKSGEKIYHLPFDQQYDRVHISGKEGAMFAWNVDEAEANGFRRARRWVPDQ